MFRKILVPTDGSTHAAKAETIGIDLAEKYGAELVFVSVVEDGSLSQTQRQLARDKGIDMSGLDQAPARAMVSPEGAPTVPHADETVASARVRAELADRLVRDAEARAKAAGVGKVKALTRDGAPADAILEAAEDEGADLVVMGSRGLGSLKGLLVGSVSQKVAHQAACSCITVK